MDHVNVYQTDSGGSKCISQRESLMSFDRTPKNVSFGRSEEKKKADVIICYRLVVPECGQGVHFSCFNWLIGLLLRACCSHTLSTGSGSSCYVMQNLVRSSVLLTQQLLNNDMGRWLGRTTRVTVSQLMWSVCVKLVHMGQENSFYSSGFRHKWHFELKTPNCLYIIFLPTWILKKTHFSFSTQSQTIIKSKS